MSPTKYYSKPNKDVCKLMFDIQVGLSLAFIISIISREARTSPRHYRLPVSKAYEAVEKDNGMGINCFLLNKFPVGFRLQKNPWSAGSDPGDVMEIK